MNQQQKNIWKIVYLMILVLLLLPLWWLGRPRTVGGNGNELQVNPGGVLARQLSEAGLSNENLGRIDPAGSAIKLATFGMRGVAIAILWHDAQEYKKRKDWNNFIATSDQIIKLEPHFASVWEFLGWELAYNASAEFDDYRERYRWVIHGFDFLVEGTEVNEKSPILKNKAGWTISQKIGIADEKVQYRRLLKEDEAFHTRYNTPSWAGRDNWLIGNEWYEQAEHQYEANGKVGIRNIAPPLFYSYPRLNLFSYARDLALDGEFANNGQKIRISWNTAGEKWLEYGKIPFNTTIPRKDDPNQYYIATLLEAVEHQQTKTKLLGELHQLQPGLYEELVMAKWNGTIEKGAGMQESLVHRLDTATDGELKIVRDHLDKTQSLDNTQPNWRETFQAAKQALLRKELGDDFDRLTTTPNIFLNEQEQTRLSEAQGVLGQLEGRALASLMVTPREVADRMTARESRQRALDIIQEMARLDEQISKSELYRGIMNYAYRQREHVVESQDEVIQARQDIFEARRDFAKGDYSSSNRLWLAAMGQWAALIKRAGFDDVAEDPQFLRDILDLAKRYVRILDQQDAIFPAVHPLQHLLMKEVVARSSYNNVVAAMEYLRPQLETIPPAELLPKLETLVAQSAGIQSSEEYMPHAPLPEVRDVVLSVSALYIDTLREQGMMIPPDFALRNFTELMLRHDTAAVELASQVSEDSVLLNTVAAEESPSEEKLGDLRTRFDDTVSKWGQLLTKYPILYVDPSLPARGLLHVTVTDYQRLAKLDKKDIPEDWPLKPFLAP